MVGGVIMAILFGVNEKMFKDKIRRDLLHHPSIDRVEPARKAGFLSQEADKNWRYYQRFHFHSTGIGTMSLAVLLLLAFVQGPEKHKIAASYLVSIGGLLYPYFWLFAALFGPTMGRPQAKASFAVFSWMGGVFLLGLLFSGYLLVRSPRLPGKPA